MYDLLRQELEAVAGDELRDQIENWGEWSEAEELALQTYLVEELEGGGTLSMDKVAENYPLRTERKEAAAQMRKVRKEAAALIGQIESTPSPFPRPDAAVESFPEYLRRVGEDYGESAIDQAGGSPTGDDFIEAASRIEKVNGILDRWEQRISDPGKRPAGIKAIREALNDR